MFSKIVEPQLPLPVHRNALPESFQALSLSAPAAAALDIIHCHRKYRNEPENSYIKTKT
jgi:hypothetical protein